MKKYKKGDVVWWWSDLGGKRNATKAVFVKYDKKGFPDQDCILAIRIGKTYTHRLRWPLKLISSSRP
jgi:hypothetical protein